MLESLATFSYEDLARLLKSLDHERTPADEGQRELDDL
jgi:hypothetical protein